MKNRYTMVLPPIPARSIFFVSFLFFLRLFCGGQASTAAGTEDGSEEWGYVQVRPKAHMFWWLYKSPHRVENESNPWPLLLWLQGGPGASGVGIGNFEEIGPLDTNLNPRSSTWLRLADLLFVDNPVGTGYSYVEDKAALVKTDEEAGADLTTLLKKLFHPNPKLQKTPLYIVAESYGGKFAVTLALSLVQAIRNRELKLRLGGVALGNSWISAEDFVFSWGPLLADVSRLDSNGLERSSSMAMEIQQLLKNGSYREATNLWSDLEIDIMGRSNNVDWYNFLQDSDMETVVSSSALELLVMKKYSRYLSNKSATSSSGDLRDLMDGAIREKLKIIPDNVSWGRQADLVFDALATDFMKPRIHEVDELLSEGVNVTIYNGQLDVICATKGVESWVRKLKWEGLQNFTNSARTPLYCGGSGKGTRGFYRSYGNLNFYWILGAGHFVPVSQPCTALKMIGEITQSPASVHLTP